MLLASCSCKEALEGERLRVLSCIPEFWVLYSKRYMGSVRLGMSRPKLPKLKVARKCLGSCQNAGPSSVGLE